MKTKRNILMSTIATTLLTVTTQSYAYDFCKTGGSYTDRSSCIQKTTDNVPGWGATNGYKNICNDTIYFYFCYQHGATNNRYLCRSNLGNPTQTGGLSAGRTKHIYRTKGSGSWQIKYWAFSCD